MALPGWLEKLYQRWQIRQAAYRLDAPDPALRERAVERLRASGRDCWPILRRIAFVEQQYRAVAAARLLYQLGDRQGLYALLQQNATGYISGPYGAELRKILREIGDPTLLSVLRNGMESQALTPDSWSLTLMIYTIQALQTLPAKVPSDIWERLLTFHLFAFETLRECRAMLNPNMEPTHYAALPTGYCLAAVRRKAIEALITLSPAAAFDLLADALKSPEHPIQMTAMYGLRLLQDPRAYVLLQPIAADRRHPLTRDARRVIESLGSDLPDALTLVRASQATQSPAELLRPVEASAEDPPEILLRASEPSE